MTQSNNIIWVPLAPDNAITTLVANALKETLASHRHIQFDWLALDLESVSADEDDQQ